MKSIAKIVFIIFISFTLVSCGTKHEDENDISHEWINQKVAIEEEAIVTILTQDETDTILLNEDYVEEMWEKIITDKVEFNDLLLLKDAILFLKWKCTQIQWEWVYFDDWTIRNTKWKFNIQTEYTLALPDYADVIDISLESEEINNIIAKNYSETHNKVIKSDSYKEIIKLLDIDDENLNYSLQKYALLMYVSDQKFVDKKVIFNEIFKKFNNKVQIDENYLTGMMFFYYNSKKECDWFLNYLMDEFNK